MRLIIVQQYVLDFVDGLESTFEPVLFSHLSSGSNAVAEAKVAFASAQFQYRSDGSDEDDGRRG